MMTVVLEEIYWESCFSLARLVYNLGRMGPWIMCLITPGGPNRYARCDTQII